MSEYDTDWKLPKWATLNIAVFFTASYFAKDDRGNIEKAREILARHKIQLNVWPPDTLGRKVVGARNFLPFTEPIGHSESAYQGLRSTIRLQTWGLGLPPNAAVVFTTYVSGGYAIAPQEFKDRQLGTNGCLISPVGNSDCVDLLHELGHCAMTCHNRDHVDDRENVMCVANGRSTLYRKQVEKLASAPFTVT